MDTLRSEFKIYLNENYTHLKDKGVLISDAFYPYRNDIGMDFWSILVDDSSIKEARLLLQQRFIEGGKHNDPVGAAHGYARALRYLKEYLENTYGSVTAYVSGNKINTETRESITTISRISPRKHVKENKDVPRPCCMEVKSYLERWDSLENYSIQESSLNKLFFETYPMNADIDDVLIKVASLNDFYSTNIYSVFSVAKHIVALGIDERLKAADETLVNDIALVTMENGATINFYSFATKYCSHHKPLEYPIYDSFVDLLLRYFRDVDGFAVFKTEELKNFVRFKQVLFQFREFYELEPYSLKDIDKYLWQLGKLKFPKKY